MTNIYNGPKKDHNFLLAAGLGLGFRRPKMG